MPVFLVAMPLLLAQIYIIFWGVRTLTQFDSISALLAIALDEKKKAAIGFAGSFTMVQHLRKRILAMNTSLLAQNWLMTAVVNSIKWKLHRDSFGLPQGTHS